MGNKLILFSVLLSFSAFLPAQNSDFYPCTPGPGGGSSFCDEICNACSLNGFSGSNDGYYQSTANGFCGTLENAQWFGFIAGEPNVAITITASNCLEGHGMQLALYDDCDSPPLDCGEGQVDGAALPITVSSSLTPGKQYFLLVDGFAGDFCNFNLNVSPPTAVYSPPIGNAAQVQGPSEMCPGATFTFATPAVPGAGGYVWNGPPGTLVNGDPVPVTVPAPEGVSVEITIGNTGGQIAVQPVNGCNQGNSAASGVVILGDEYRPVLTLDSLAGLSCVSDLTTLHVKVHPNGDYRYEWSTTDGRLVDGADSPEPVLDSVGTYTVVVSNALNGCSSTDSVVVGAPLVPDSVDLTLTPVRCYGEKNGVITINQVFGGTEPFLTSLNELPLGPAAEYSFLATGNYLLTIEGADGCRWDSLLYLPQPDELLVNLGEDTTIHLGQTIQLWSDEALSDPARKAELLVTPNVLQTMACDSCWYMAPASFRYEVMVRDSAGCEAADERVVTVNKERYMFIPNAFRPDEAGTLNGEFRIYGGEDVEKVLSLQVYDYWGALVFEAYDFSPNETGPAWDGRSHGEKLAPGVFLYAAEVAFRDGAKQWFKGDVTLVR
ncbi:MAG: gliding motility-associated C-terminal domain-containing protein [Saprospiraceae bacterium]|nr:gliding motility-associated C-terminal domain-containing protein [Saprospiraceae bacterium]